MKRFPDGFSEKLLSVAVGQIGKREIGVNGGLAVRAYQSATWMDPGPWPWCAAFVCWCFKVASMSHLHDLPLPQTPSARGLLDWGNRHASRIVGPPFKVSPGDVVVYRFPTGHHCGIVSQRIDGNTFEAVEGNTNLRGSREGDGVFMRRRSFEFVLGVVNLNF